MGNDFLEVEEAAEFLRMSKSTLDKDRINKKIGIPYSRLGGRVLYSRERLREFVLENEIKTLSAENTTSGKVGRPTKAATLRAQGLIK